jgi:uncharacterized protein (TIGR03437 family)
MASSAWAQLRLEPAVGNLNFTRDSGPEGVSTEFTISGVPPSTPIVLRFAYPDGAASGWARATRDGNIVMVTVDEGENPLEPGFYVAYLEAASQAGVAVVTVRLQITPTDNQFRFYRDADRNDRIEDNRLALTEASRTANLFVDFLGTNGLEAGTEFQLRVQTLDAGLNWLSVDAGSQQTPSGLAIAANSSQLVPRATPYQGAVTVSRADNPNNQTVLYVEFTVAGVAGQPSRLESDREVTFSFTGPGLASGSRGYWIDVPEESSKLEVGASSPVPVRLHVRRNADVDWSGTDVVADASTAEVFRPMLELTPSTDPPLREGRYYIAIETGSAGPVTGQLAARVTSPQITVTPTVADAIAASDFGGTSVAAPGSFIEIYGSNLAGSTRGWATADFDGRKAPTTLDGVTVTVGGRPAYISYISPNQVNAQVPGDTALGSTVPVVVTYNGRSSAERNITVNAVSGSLLAPPIFRVNGRQYAVAFHTDGPVRTLVSDGRVPGVAAAPVRRGEILEFYGLGFGPVTPGNAAGEIAQGESRVLNDVQFLFGSIPGDVRYQGLSPNYVGLYQFNVVVPDGIPAGDVALVVSSGGTPIAQSLYLPVQ